MSFEDGVPLKFVVIGNGEARAADEEALVDQVSRHLDVHHMVIKLDDLDCIRPRKEDTFPDLAENAGWLWFGHRRLPVVIIHGKHAVDRGFEIYDACTAVSANNEPSDELDIGTSEWFGFTLERAEAHVKSDDQAGPESGPRRNNRASKKQKWKTKSWAKFERLIVDTRDNKSLAQHIIDKIEVGQDISEAEFEAQQGAERKIEEACMRTMRQPHFLRAIGHPAYSKSLARLKSEVEEKGVHWEAQGAPSAAAAGLEPNAHPSSTWKSACGGGYQL